MKLSLSRPSHLVLRSSRLGFERFRIYRLATSGRINLIYRFMICGIMRDRISRSGKCSDRFDDDRIIRLNSRSLEVELGPLLGPVGLVGLEPAVSRSVVARVPAEPMIRNIVGVVAEEVFAVFAIALAAALKNIDFVWIRNFLVYGQRTSSK